MLTRARVIAQGVALADPMTRGLAHKLRDRFPAMVEEFQQWCSESGAVPGQVWLWGEPDKLQVISMITHEGDADPTWIGRPDRIALNRCFRALNSLYAEHRFPSLAMPLVGAGEFGLDQALVWDMMRAQLGELLIPIFVYAKQLDGQVAHEPGL